MIGREALVAEWIRRWTLNLKGSACMFDSRHGRLFFFYDDDDDGVTRNGAGERRRAGMSAANVGASFTYIMDCMLKILKFAKNKIT